MLNTTTIEGCIVSIMLYLVLFLYAMQYRSNRGAGGSNVLMFVHLFIVLFCIFAFWDTDYYHYKEGLENINSHYGVNDQYNHLELLYIWLYNNVCGRSYFVFRLVVWGVAYLLFVVTTKKLDIYNHFTFSSFIVIFLLTFSYARVSLGMVSFFFACVLLFSKQNRALNVAMGVLCLVLCYFAHRSMLVLLCLLPLSVIKYNRYLLWAMMVAVIVVVFYNAELILSMLFSEIDIMDTTDASYESMYYAGAYVEWSDEIRVGVSAILFRILQYASILLPVIFCMQKQIYQYCSSIMRYRVLCNVMIFIIVVAMSMGLLTSFYSALCYRFIYMAYIPIVLLTSILYSNQILSRKQVISIIFLGGLTSWYRLAYTIYGLVLVN